MTVSWVLYMNPKVPTHFSMIPKAQIKSSSYIGIFVVCTAPFFLDSTLQAFLIDMYLQTLALLSLLIPRTTANGCHQGKDNIGCPTVMATVKFTTAIADFCNAHFLVPNSAP